MIDFMLDSCLIVFVGSFVLSVGWFLIMLIVAAIASGGAEKEGR